jgi:adenosylmethionine-8-amino-7-oxononanoate aminotransferase
MTPQMDSEHLLNLDRTLVWHPCTQAGTAAPPVPIRSASGAVLTDIEGREVLDLISSRGAILHGHGHPAIAAAVARQAHKLGQVMFAGFTHEPAVDLCRRLTGLLPGGLHRCFFSDNGSTAVEVALKMALQAWRNHGVRGRTRFLAFDGGCHGDTVGAMSVGVSSGLFEAWRELLFPVDVLPVPHTWMADGEVQDRETAALAVLDRHLERHGANTLAAVIEPLVQGGGGMLMHRPAFLRAVVERLRSRGVLVILDEVMTGFGRTGEGFACLEAQVAPDILCLAQGLTGGALPMGLTVTTEPVYQAFLDEAPEKAFQSGHACTANPLACAAALASLDLFVDPACALARKQIEHCHRTGLAQVLLAEPHVSRLRIQGTIAAMEVAGSPGLNARMERFFLGRGLLLQPLGSTLYLMPPYCITDAQLDRAYETIVEGLGCGFADI